MILFIILAVLAIVSILLFEDTMEKWARATDPKLRERYSIIWHIAKWWAMMLVILLVIALKDLWVWLLWLPLCTGIFSILFDGYKGIKYKRGFWYPGDGKGGVIEVVVFKITEFLNVNRTVFYAVSKFVWTIGGGVLLYFMWNW